MSSITADSINKPPPFISWDKLHNPLPQKSFMLKRYYFPDALFEL